MQHWREEVRVQRRVAEPLLQTIAFAIGTCGMDFGFEKLLFGGDVVPEPLIEDAVDVNFEQDDDGEGRDRRDPCKRSPTILKADG